MKYTSVLFGAILFFAAGARAQVNQETSVLPPPSAAGATPAASASGTPSLFALSGAPPAGAASALGTPAVDLPASSGTADQKPTVYGVFQNYNWQAYAGYTFLRFYVVPKVTETMNGINLGIVYYPKGRWIGVDGEFVGAWGNAFGHSSRFGLGAAGPRFRWSAPLGLEVWGHGLVGGSRFLPQTAFGSQNSFAYLAGGGVDIAVHQHRIAYRVSADVVGTHFFGTYQYSPKVSVGVVFKF